MNRWCERCSDHLLAGCQGYDGAARPGCHVATGPAATAFDPRTGNLADQTTAHWPDRCPIGEQPPEMDLAGDGRAAVETQTRRGFSSFSPAAACCDQAAQAVCAHQAALLTDPAGLSPRPRRAVFFANAPGPFPIRLDAERTDPGRTGQDAQAGGGADDGVTGGGDGRHGTPSGLPIDPPSRRSFLNAAHHALIIGDGHGL